MSWTWLSRMHQNRSCGRQFVYNVGEETVLPEIAFVWRWETSEIYSRKLNERRFASKEKREILIRGFPEVIYESSDAISVGPDLNDKLAPEETYKLSLVSFTRPLAVVKISSIIISENQQNNVQSEKWGSECKSSAMPSWKTSGDCFVRRKVGYLIHV